MDEDYFLSPPAATSGPKDELGRPLSSGRDLRGWLGALSFVGRLIYWAGLLMVALLPVAGILLLFWLMDSLPF